MRKQRLKMRNQDDKPKWKKKAMINGKAQMTQDK
jgi:hypothetical protein